MNTAEELAERLARVKAAGYGSARRVIAVGEAECRGEPHPIKRALIAAALQELKDTVAGIPTAYTTRMPSQAWPSIPASVATPGAASTQPIERGAP